MDKIEIFSGQDEEELQGAVNEFLDDDDLEVISIDTCSVDSRVCITVHYKIHERKARRPW